MYSEKVLLSSVHVSYSFLLSGSELAGSHCSFDEPH